MISTRNDKQQEQGVMSLFSALFGASAAAPGRRSKGAAIRVQKPAGPAALPVPRSKLTQAICHALVTLTLASAMGGLLVAYNLRDTIGVQAAQWVMVVQG